MKTRPARWAWCIASALMISCACTALAGSARVGAVVQTQPGYRLLAGDGGVFTFGARATTGPRLPTRPNARRTRPSASCPRARATRLASTPDGDGYWILNRALGKIYAFGDAGSFGQPADQFAGVGAEFVPAFVSIVSTPNGHGYWVLALEPSDAGRVMHFGNAGFFGDTQTIISQTHRSFNGIPVALAATPDGNGYWEVHSDGGVFAFGDAHFYGSMGGAHLNKPVVGIAPTGDGKGYWLVASDGGVFAFGDARFGGSLAGKRLAGPVVGIARNPLGSGYWLASSDGGVYALGGAPFFGSMGGKPLNKPVLAIASSGAAA